MAYALSDLPAIGLPAGIWLMLVGSGEFWEADVDELVYGGRKPEFNQLDKGSHR